MKAIRDFIFYLVLSAAALAFLFPFLWMLITSLKVPGTGDKFLYVPKTTQSFQQAKAEDLKKLGLLPVEIGDLVLESAIRHLYSKPGFPQTEDMISTLQNLAGKKLKDAQKSTLTDRYSPQLDVNRIEEQGLVDFLGISREDAQVVLEYRSRVGEFDQGIQIKEIPLFDANQALQIKSLHKIDPKSLSQLDASRFQESMNLSEHQSKRYHHHRNRYGISSHDLKEVLKISYFAKPVLDRARKIFFSNKLYTLSNYKRVFSQSPRGDDFTFLRALLNSFFVSTGTALLTLLLCTLGGYVFAKKEFPGKSFLYFTFWASMMIPGMMFVVPQYAIITKLQWINSYKAMIIPHAASIFGLYLMKQYIEQIPHTLFEAATIDGAGELDLFQIIILPLTSPILATLFLMTFLSQWSNFLWQLIVNTPDSMAMTLPVTLALFKGQYSTEWTVMMAGSAIMILPIVFLFLFTQKYFVQGMTQGAVKE